MGVIQNSLNSMLATIMGGVIGMKHIEGQQEQLKSSELMELASLGDKEIESKKELIESAEKYVGARKESDLIEKGQMKLYTNDSKEPVWVDKKYDEGEWSTQRNKAKTAVESAKKEVNSKALTHLLIQRRQKELEGKYGSDIDEEIRKKHLPSKEQQKEMKKQEKENIKKGVF